MSAYRTDDVLVRFTAGTHVTSTVRGVRTSSTMSAGEAATRLGRKLYAETFVRAELVRRVDGMPEHWRIVARQWVRK